MSDKYNWDYDSDNQIEVRGKKVDISELLESEDMILAFKETFGIIRVGTASCEGLKNSENNKAYKRAVTLDKELKQALEKHEGLRDEQRYTLNLGQYKKYERKCSSKTEKTEKETAIQRRVIIISITGRDRDVNLKQALRDAIKNREDLSFDIENYNLFELTESN